MTHLLSQLLCIFYLFITLSVLTTPLPSHRLIFLSLVSLPLSFLYLSRFSLSRFSPTLSFLSLFSPSLTFLSLLAGEPTPYAWPDINSNFGILDIAGYPKDTFYYYQVTPNAMLLDCEPFLLDVCHFSFKKN